MDAVAWAVGAFTIAFLAHFMSRSWFKGSALGAVIFSAGAIFVWPIVRGHGISNIWPIALVFHFVCAFLVSAVAGIPFAMARRK